jgi:hypothetical protein
MNIDPGSHMQLLYLHSPSGLIYTKPTTIYDYSPHHYSLYLHLFSPQ